MCKSFTKSSFSYRRQFSPTHTAQVPTPETHSAKSTKTIPPKKDNTALKKYRRPFPASRENNEKEKATQNIYTRKKSTIFPELTRTESQKAEHKSDVFSPKTKNKSDTMNTMFVASWGPPQRIRHPFRRSTRLVKHQHDPIRSHTRPLVLCRRKNGSTPY